MWHSPSPKTHHDEGHENQLVYGFKVSSVVPARMSGEDKVHELTGLDLVMKLHYIRGIYFFNSEVGQAISIFNLKEGAFPCLAHCFVACGRIRVSDETGRPFIKLNDSGVRVVEAKCSKTIEEWLDMNDHDKSVSMLVQNHSLGPDLGFTPLVFLQFTWFKCGGLTVGLSWAHVLGDIFSAAAFMNVFGQFVQGHRPSKPLGDPHKPEYTNLSNNESVSLKRVGPVVDHWIAPVNFISSYNKMGRHTFQLYRDQLDRLYSSIGGSETGRKFGSFEVISAVIWKSIAKVKEEEEEKEPKIVTICRAHNDTRRREDVNPINGQVISRVSAANDKVSEADLSKLAMLMSTDDEKKREIMNGNIEQVVDQQIGKYDFVFYGATLTFVDMEGADIYGFQLEKGQSPILAYYAIDGVAERGAVWVLHAAPHNEDKGSTESKLVTVTLPENELQRLRDELRQTWHIV